MIFSYNRHFGRGCQSHLQWSSSPKEWFGQLDRWKWDRYSDPASETNYQLTPCNIPEDRRPQLHHGGRL